MVGQGVAPWGSLLGVQRRWPTSLVKNQEGSLGVGLRSRCLVWPPTLGDPRDEFLLDIHSPTPEEQDLHL